MSAHASGVELALRRALAFAARQRLFAPGDRVLVGMGSDPSSLGLLGFLLHARAILGVAENMSFLEAADGSRQYLFGQGGGLKVATALDSILLGEVPLDPAIRQGGDHGIPVVISHPDGNPARVFRSIGLTVLNGLEKAS